MSDDDEEYPSSGAPGESDDDNSHDESEAGSSTEESEESDEDDDFRKTEKEEEPTPYCSESLSVLEGHYSFVRAVCFHPTRELCVSASADTYLRVWDAASMLPSRVSPKPMFTRALVRNSLIYPVT